jgi:hypothetical protein
MSFMHWIEHPSEPKQLLLVWQPPLFVTDRLRWAVGHITRTGDEILFDYLAGEEFARFNNGRTPAELRAAGYVGYPAFDPDSRPDGGYGDYVLKTFLRRLPPTNRRDFPDYLAHYHIPRTAQLSSMALLAITEARLPSDGFSLIDPFDPHAKCVDVVFEVAGYRHITKFEPVQLGQSLTLEVDPANPRDPGAVQVFAAGQPIGYVNRLQGPAVAIWLRERKTDCWVARINGTPAIPRAYAFLQVRCLV